MSTPHDEANPAVRFEQEDIRATPVLRFLIGISITTVVVCFLLLAFYRAMRSHLAARQPPPPHMQFAKDREPPPPRLQEQPASELAAIRAEEEATLSSYGVLDEKTGVVHIPIEAAMRLLAQRGLPVTPVPEPAKRETGAPK